MDDEVEAALREISHGKPLPKSRELLLRIHDQANRMLASEDEVAVTFRLWLSKIEVANSIEELENATPPSWSDPRRPPLDFPISQVSDYFSEEHMGVLVSTMLELEKKKLQEDLGTCRSPEKLILLRELGPIPPKELVPVELSEARQLRLERVVAQADFCAHRKNAMEDLRRRVELAIEQRGTPRSTEATPNEAQLKHARKLFLQNPKTTKNTVRNACSCGSEIATKIITQMRSEGLCASLPRRKE